MFMQEVYKGVISLNHVEVNHAPKVTLTQWGGGGGGGVGGDCTCKFQDDNTAGQLV